MYASRKIKDLKLYTKVLYIFAYFKNFRFLVLLTKFWRNFIFTYYMYLFCNWNENRKKVIRLDEGNVLFDLKFDFI